MAELFDAPLIGTFLKNMLIIKNKFHLVRRSALDPCPCPPHTRSLAASGMFSPLMHPVEPLSKATLSLHAQLAIQSSPQAFIAFQQPKAHVAGTFHYHTIEEYHAAFLSGQTTPVEVARRFLAFLANEKEHLNAVPELNEADVLAQAEASTERYKSGQQLGRVVDNGVRHC
jgi:hypothetical protein